MNLLMTGGGALADKYTDMDAVIKKMQEVVAAKREQDPEFYAKYPINLGTLADDQAVREVTDQWSLPDDYVYFLKHYVPESVTWSTDEYTNLEIYGAKDILKGQWGYNYNPVTHEDIVDWPSSYLVIASDEGDPYCIDLSRGDTVIYTAAHGMGKWDFSVAYGNLEEFLHSVLVPRGFEEWDTSGDEPYEYYKVFLTGEGSDKKKTLLFIKKMFSCDFSQAKAYLEATPLLVYKGLEPGAAKTGEQLKSIGAEFEVRKVSVAEFLSY